MKNRRHLKSIVRWTAWVLALLLPVMWVVSLYFAAVARTPRSANGHFMGVGLADGCFAFIYTLAPSKVDPSFPLIGPARYAGLSVGNPNVWRPDIDRSPAGVQVMVPLWMPWLVAIAFSVWFYRDHRREEQRRLNGCCPCCGYSRNGLSPNAPCPECGSSPATTST